MRGEIWLRLTAIHCHRVSFAPAFHIHVLIMINNKQPGGVRSDLAKLVLIASEHKFLLHDWYTLGNYNGLQTTTKRTFSCCCIYSYGEDLHANIQPVKAKRCTKTNCSVHENWRMVRIHLGILSLVWTPSFYVKCMYLWFRMFENIVWGDYYVIQKGKC